MLNRFHLILERYGPTDRQTDRFAISISRVSMLTHDKNTLKYAYFPHAHYTSNTYGTTMPKTAQQSHNNNDGTLCRRWLS